MITDLDLLLAGSLMASMLGNVCFAIAGLIQDRRIRKLERLHPGAVE